MCNYQTWFHNAESGYVVECVQCNKLQVAFGNLAITLSAAEFENFRQYLQQAVAGRDYTGNNKIKTVMINTPAPGICFLLSEDELQGLQQMIEYADNEMKADSLLKLFNEDVH